MQQNQLAGLRQQIDTIDEQITHLLDQRAAIARQVGAAKNSTGVYRPAREAQVLTHVTQSSIGNMPAPALQSIYKEIIAACRNLQQPLAVAYLGPEGTYCEQAARQHCGTTSKYLPAPTIDAAIAMAQNGQAHIAIVPAENSTEGPVTRTLDALLQSPLTICGEIILPIRHQLLSNDTLKDIRRVMAHPQAIAQCRQWLDTNLAHATRITAASNAQAASDAATQPGSAAIASVRAAELYKLPVRASNIQDSAINATRFLVLSTDATQPTGHDKTSLICTTPNKPGALHQVLAQLAQQNINIVKLESRPATSALWDYIFYIDIDGHQADPHVATALKKLQSSSTIVKILGSYPKGT